MINNYYRKNMKLTFTENMYKVEVIKDYKDHHYLTLCVFLAAEGPVKHLHVA